MRTVGALLFFIPFTSAFLAPTASLPRGRAAAAHHHRHHATSSSSFVSRVQASSPSAQLQQRRQSRSSLNMVEQNVIYGGLVALAGLVAGAGLVALTEKAGVRSEERGALSYERKMKMQAMFMEDDVVETSDVDDVRYNMRKALRANQTEEELLELTADARKRAAEEADDGW
ncbi:unnamed protein product [Pylaiella littoralis]